MELGTQRFSLIPLFLLGTVFSILAPFFWTHVESPVLDAGPVPHENAELYGRVLPTLQYTAERVRAGQWPLWADGQYCGIPFFANPNHGLFQPLNLIFLFVPIHTGLALHAFLGLLLMGFFTALYLRALGTGYISATIGSMAYTFGGATAAVMSRPELLSVLVWVPLVYWIIFEYTRQPRSLYVVLGGIVAALMLLAGTPSLALLLLASALSYGLVRTLGQGRRGDTPLPRRLGGLALIALVGILLSAVQWLPYVAWLTTLARPSEALWPWNWGGHVPASAPELFGAFLLPGAAAQPGMLHMGVVALILIPVAVFQKRGRSEVLYFALAAVLWIAAAVWMLDGSTSTEWAKALVFPGVFSLAVLSGLGADRLLLAGRDPRSPLIWGSALMMFASATAALILGPPEARGHLLIALLILLPFFLLRVRWMGVICGTTLAFLVFVELRGASNNVYQHPYTDDENWLGDSLPALWEAEAIALGERVLTLPTRRPTTLPANVGLLLGVSNAHGAYWPLSAAQDAWWKHLDPYLTATSTEASDAKAAEVRYPALLNYLAVRVIVGERNLPWMDAPPETHGLSIQYLRPMGRLSLWRNNSAFPRVRMVSEWQATNDIDGALELLLDPEFPGNRRCVVEAEGAGWTALNSALPPQQPGEIAEADFVPATCLVSAETPEMLTVTVDADQAGILVLADSYAPGWRVTVDGKRADMLKVNGLFRGVYLPEGEHRVQFSYGPFSVTLGLLLSACGVLVCLFWLTRLGGYAALTFLRELRGDATERKTAP